MNKIVMKSNIFEVLEIKKKTKARMFKNLTVGSKILLSIEAKTAGQNRGTYASYITVENIQSQESVAISFNEVEARLSPFVLGEI